MPTPVYGTRRRTKSSEPNSLGKAGADLDVPQFEPGPIRSTSLSDVDVSETSSDDYTPTQEHAPAPPVSSTTARTSSPSVSAPAVTPRTSTPWMEVDPSIALALAMPIGSWLTGGDHLKHIFLAILLVVYLHQLISVPWELYRASRTRRPHTPYQASPQSDAETPELDRLRELASSELQTLEIFYLLLSAGAPFIGAILLRYVLHTVSGPNELSWFSATLFILTTGLRPWSHLISRLRKRTESLHDAVHYPSPDLQLLADSRLKSILDRVEALETELAEAKRLVATKDHVEEVVEDLDDSIDRVEQAVEKIERAVESGQAAASTRMAALEKSIARALSKGRNEKVRIATAGVGNVPAYAMAQSYAHPHTGAVFSALVRILFYFWSIATLSFLFKPTLPPPPSPYRRTSPISPNKPNLTHIKTPRRLETIIEVSQEAPGESSPSDSDLADNEGPKSPSQTHAESPVAQSAADLAADVVTLPYRASLGILSAVARVVR
ncbi:unnamed protein product [Peniophora sp. CBMAI 1063]|nr:unnamed protein product [Peniophora sp. CBMAI 1063]